MRPRLKLRLGVEGKSLALQEASDLPRPRAEALIRAVAPLTEVALVFAGGGGERQRADLLSLARELGMGERVHFIAEIPTARRVEYLGEADVGLGPSAEADGRPGRLPAADLFDALGIPFVAAGEELDPAPEHRVAAADLDPEALREAIATADERGRAPARDGALILSSLLLDLGRRSTAGPGPASVASEDGSAMLLSRAGALRKQGNEEQATELYLRIAADSPALPVVAAAATELARLDVREQARAALDRVTGASRPPALATARAGEAAALLGDLVRARSCAEGVVQEQSASQAALQVAIRVLERAGELRMALRIAREVGDEASVERIKGTLVSYDPTWLPTSVRRGARLEPKAGRVFTLLETSLPHSRSGYTYRARTLLRAQRSAGLEPTALTRLGFPFTRGLDSPPVEEVDGIAHHRAGLPGVEYYSRVPIPAQLRENVRWAATLAREIRPEGIVATTPHLNALVGLALRREMGVPVVYDVRGFPEMTWAVRKGGDRTDVFALRRIAETRCMREADLVTTLSETMRRQIIGRGVPAENVFVLPHAVDTDAFAPAERNQELAARLGLAGRPVVGYVSSLVAYEGVETLLKAIAVARRSDPDLAGLIVGGGELQSSLEARARRLGLDGHVVFTGRVDASEAVDCYSLMDVFVCPRDDHEVTRYVTPLKPFEAMAAGCCIAVSDLPTLREAVRDGECGALFPAGDSEALAATMLNLIDRPERSQEMRRAARRHAVQDHGLDSLSRRLEGVWEEMRMRAKQIYALR
jgi:glycosyltransferase involved in cell wall biosynthesis